MKVDLKFLGTLTVALFALPALAADKVSLRPSWDHQFTNAGFHAAQWQGYYAAAELDVEIKSGFTPNRKRIRLRRFKKASLKGSKYALAHPEKIAQRTSKELPRELPAKNLEKYNLLLATEVRELIQGINNHFRAAMLVVFVLILMFGAWGFSLKRAVRMATMSYLAAKNRAEAANRSKSEFLANMSHELRTPLNSVIGFSEVMTNQSFGPIGNEKYLEYSEYIRSSGQHLLGLINDILDLSKIEIGNIQLNEEVFDPNKVIQSTLAMVKGQAKSEHIDLVMEFSEQLAPLYADQRSFKQIMINLLSNAVKFTPDGGKVTLRAWSQSESGHVFQVIDTGIGVALHDIPKILKPFTQIESSLGRKYQGTGLGLPLVKEIVELHGGVLDFQSELGVGSTVTVRFPKERIVAPQVNAKTASAA